MSLFFMFLFIFRFLKVTVVTFAYFANFIGVYIVQKDGSKVHRKICCSIAEFASFEKEQFSLKEFSFPKKNKKNHNDIISDNGIFTLEKTG